tara:strand:- start:937 stop:1884 length:948 start_codon:yes stop_codon:yes gene_type:complete
MRQLNSDILQQILMNDPRLNLRLVSKQFKTAYNSQIKLRKYSKLHDLTNEFLIWFHNFLNNNSYKHLSLVKQIKNITPTMNIKIIQENLWFKKHELRKSNSTKKALIDKIVTYYFKQYVKNSNVYVGDFLFLSYGRPGLAEKDKKWCYQVSQKTNDSSSSSNKSSSSSNTSSSNSNKSSSSSNKNSSDKTITSKMLPKMIRNEIMKFPNFYKNLIKQIQQNTELYHPSLFEKFHIGVYFWSEGGELMTYNQIKEILQYYYNKKYINNPRSLSSKTTRKRQPNRRQTVWYKKNFNENNSEMFIKMYKNTKPFYNLK